MSVDHSDIQLPIPISRLGHRYYVYDINHVTYLRVNHNIPGVLVGSLPQAANQNVFLGLPLELMPEEARLLVEDEVAYLVNDAKAMRVGLQGLPADDRKRYLRSMYTQGLDLARKQLAYKSDLKAAALKRQAAQVTQQVNNAASVDVESRGNDAFEDDMIKPAVTDEAGEETEEEQIFTTSAPIRPDSAQSTSISLVPYHITPTTSNPPFHEPPPSSTAATEDFPTPIPASSFALYRHLHSSGYFLSPGLRFGCRYMAYPGDQLRYHSHFLVSPVEKDEEVAVMDIVGSGRLGTGVKKGVLLGGLVGKGRKEESGVLNEEGKVRCFTVEWSGM